MALLGLPLLSTLLAMTALTQPEAAHAEAADRDKPINVQADNMTYDDLKQVNIITGNVVITKGTITIKADRVEIHQDPQGYQYATGTSEGGKLAYFRQKRDGVNEYIEGQAVRIDYDGKRDFTTLTTRAVVRRLQGTTKVIDEVHGDVITYDGQKDFYTASSSGGPASSSGSGSGRIRATLAPRNSLDGASATPGISLSPAGDLQNREQP